MSASPAKPLIRAENIPAYIGIDPGSTGAIAHVHNRRVTVFGVPLLAKPVGGCVIDDDEAIGLARMLFDLGPAVVVIEQTWGIRGQGGASQYKFGDTAAALRVAFRSAGFRVHRVPAIRWTARLRVGSNKDQHVAEALKLFPEDAAAFTKRRGVLTYEQVKGNADAALIAEYGRVECLM